MATYQITGPDGGTYQVTAPDSASQDEVLAYAKQNYAPASAPQSRGMLDQLSDAASAFAHHAMNLPHGIAQGVENLADSAANRFVPGTSVANWLHQTAQQDNQAMAQREKDYQSATPNSASAYLGAAAGEVAPWLAAGPAKAIQAIGDTGAGLAAKVLPGEMLPRAVGGALQGVAGTATAPVTSGDYFDEKSSQLKYAPLLGAVAPTLLGGASKVISPSANPDWERLANAGVQTTIGQRLGGVLNNAEDKAQSLPFVGDFISRARGRALNSWNEATLNDVLKPIGETVSQAGHDGVAEAGDKLSAAYRNVLGKVQGVTFDPQFAQDFAQLRQMGQGLTPDMAARFENIIKNNFESRLSPANGMTSETLKSASSDIGSLARKYSGSSVASEQELGAALSQLDSLINQQVSRANPQYAATLNAIDQGWAKLVRVEKAATAAASNKVNTGVFTPSQLMSAVRATDQSVRDRGTARGTALMQDWAQSALSVLGDKVPNSGTFDRGANGAAIVGLLAHPEYLGPAVMGTAASGALYSPAGQKAAISLATSRPQQAKALAAMLRKYIPSAP